MGNARVAMNVWDIWIRLFHWGLAAAIGILFYTTKTSGAPFLFPVEVHAQAGYLVLGLLVFRWLWGILGSVYARFTTFLYPPAKTLTYSKTLLKCQPSTYASHNPLGGWMVVLMLLSLTFQAVSGLFLSDDIFFQAPLYGALGEGVGSQLRTLHQWNSDLLIILIGLHLLGLVIHRLLGEQLLTAMVTGKKHISQPPLDTRNEPLMAAKLRVRALGALLMAAGVVLWLWF